MPNIFSESRGIVDDAFQNANEVNDADNDIREGVKERNVPDGVLMLNDCPYCGMQRWSLVKWPEVFYFFTGQQVPGTQATQAGVAMQLGCKCGRPTTIGITWDDLDRYVAAAVKRGWLPQTIYQARAQIQAERAKQQGQQQRR